ncbi:Na+-translocating ferredoxin:NAD+ oxidoreductase RNF, RnfC subunit [Tindallia magadiensis]|uniref:Na+-translocating ferredoxin:NAD+ oxidoreductase RNF, RnfC subunit n=1 Tax=Tindallia magadiensis TaxID=69895 RepID=A0A1I3BW78_9FIRM|nr:4Fe-4S dicluster domain-containing protein [Tindallia magadiensis]SFH66189.1 Na+-translocating ferredoxin:NAD+ oxidoreductase RNF, RnfC subunit [Tindallia magadiensis]
MTFLEGIKKAGVVGAGGAGFPTHIKLDTQAKTLIINGIECEPLLKTDKFLIRRFSEALIQGALIIGEHLKAQEIVIAIKEKNKTEIEQLQRCLKPGETSLKIHPVADFYPAGDEQMLVREVMAETVAPGKIPLSKGVVITNVATVLDIVHQQPVTHRIMTIGGEVNQPCLIKVPIGTDLQSCIEAAGGPKISDYHALTGGPMMGQLCPRSELSSTYVTKTMGGLILLPSHHPIIQHHHLSISHCLKRAASVCIQCRMCTDLCPRYLNGHPLHPHLVMRSVAFGKITMESSKSALLCCACGVCEHFACPMGLSPKMINESVKSTLMQGGVKWVNTEEDFQEVHPLRSYRKIPTDRLIQRLGLSIYETDVPETLQSLTPDKVVIPLKQHIGVLAKPVVENGERVVVGQLIASVGTDLGSEIHSSLDGTVKKVEKDYIMVERS